MRSQFSKTATIFFTPQTLLPFLLGSIFLAVLGNAIWQILLNFVSQYTKGDTTWASAQIALGALLIFTLSVLLFAQGLRQLDPQTIADARIPAKHRGLILLVSREVPCRVAIQHHLPRLERCWLLCSDETRSIAESLQNSLAQEKLTFKLIHINDVYDPMEFYQHGRRIYAQLPPDWSPQQIISDYTGMTAHASVGMVLASLFPSPNAPLQYTPAHPDQPGESLTPIEIVLRSQATTRNR
jgi:hypothetical protein